MVREGSVLLCLDYSILEPLIIHVMIASPKLVGVELQ